MEIASHRPLVQVVERIEEVPQTVVQVVDRLACCFVRVDCVSPSPSHVSLQTMRAALARALTEVAALHELVELTWLAILVRPGLWFLCALACEACAQGSRPRSGQAGSFVRRGKWMHNHYTRKVRECCFLINSWPRSLVAKLSMSSQRSSLPSMVIQNAHLQSSILDRSLKKVGVPVHNPTFSVLGFSAMRSHRCSVDGFTSSCYVHTGCEAICRHIASVSTSRYRGFQGSLPQATVRSWPCPSSRLIQASSCLVNIVDVVPSFCWDLGEERSRSLRHVSEKSPRP